MLRFAKLGQGIALLVVYGRLFGIGLAMDAWVFASGAVAAAGMLVWGPVNEIARARYLKNVADHGNMAAVIGANQLLRFTVAVTLVLILAMFALGPWVVGVLYSGDQANDSGIVLRLFTLMLPSLLLGQILSLGTAYLNCLGVIYAPEWIGVGAGISSLCIVLLLAPSVGIYALAAGQYFSSALSMILVLGLLLRHRFLLGTRMPIAGRAVWDYLGFASPLYMSYAAGQANGILEKSLASSIATGALSSINYASQIKSTLQAVISSVLFSLAVPRLTQAASDVDDRLFLRTWRDVQRLVCIFLLLLLPPILGAADLIAELLFNVAKSGGQQPANVALLIRLYAVALLPVSLYLVHGAALLARQNGRAYAAWGLISQIVSGLCCIVFVREFGTAIFPVALFFSHGIAAFAMAKSVGPSRKLWIEFSMIVLLVLTMSVVAWGGVIFIHQQLDSPLAVLAIFCAIYSILAGSVGLLLLSRKRANADA